jgi:DNA-binding transcriptional LysR family regulator
VASDGARSLLKRSRADSSRLAETTLEKLVFGRRDRTVPPIDKEHRNRASRSASRSGKEFFGAASRAVASEKPGVRTGPSPRRLPRFTAPHDFSSVRSLRSREFDQLGDLVGEGFDLAVRFGTPTESSLISKLLETRTVTVAKRYLTAHNKTYR